MKRQFQYRLCLINTIQRDPEDAINSWGVKGWRMVNCWPNDGDSLRVVFEKRGKIKNPSVKKAK